MTKKGRERENRRRKKVSRNFFLVLYPNRCRTVKRNLGALSHCFTQYAQTGDGVLFPIAFFVECKGWEEERISLGIIVQKFGGSSIATIERIKKVALLVEEEVKRNQKVVVVVSAMGDTTEELLQLAHQLSMDPSRREMDMLLSTGEVISMALLAITLNDRGMKAISLTGWQAGIQTEKVFGQARIVGIDTTKICQELDQGKVVIVAGFQGITKDGEITTLGRGGSDITAVALAASLKAERCDIYTDVPGVFSSDPRFVPEARQLSTLSYDEMLEMSNLGATVLHPRAVEFAKNYFIPLTVKSSFEQKPGSWITGETLMEDPLIVRGVTFEKDVAKITLFGLNNGASSLSSIFSPLAWHHINVDIIIQSTTRAGKTNISFSVKSKDLKDTLLVLEREKEAISYESLEWEPHLAKVSIIGSGMVSNPGVAAKMFENLWKENIDIKMVTTSEIKVSAVVKEQDVVRAARILHKTFELGKVPPIG